jgi:hypothetical protein
MTKAYKFKKKENMVPKKKTPRMPVLRKEK